MAVVPANALVAITGAVSKGLLSATAPTGTSGALTGFNDLGGISEDGVVLSLPDNGDATPIKVWQGGATVRTLRESSDDLPTLAFTMIESKKETGETYFGSTITQTATEGSIQFTVANRAADSYVLDVIDGAELLRLYVPRGVVTSVGEINFVNTDAISYEVTMDLELDAVKGYNFKLWNTKWKS